MKYLGCFLKEVMRQHTPVPVISRMLDEPCVVDGVELPKGSFIDLAIHHAHHHPDVWEDPWVCHYLFIEYVTIYINGALYHVYISLIKPEKITTVFI